jgi:AhpD family alkylhydroperoxidase
VEVDQQLVTFAADVDWLKKRGVTVERFNLAQQPQAFATDVAIRQLLETQGETALPAVVVDGQIKQCGGYPSRDQLAAWAGTATVHSIFTEQVAELVAIGAAIASNCEPCFKFHYDKAHKLGVADADMRRAMDLAQRVKETPARAVLDLASRTLDKKASLAAISVVAASGAQPRSSCCGPSSAQAAPTASKCC